MRQIEEIIIHCTATPQGRETTVADVDGWHRQRGFAKIGYHYLIALTGEIWQGRGENEIGAHCLNHNAKSIGVCYVGGLSIDGKTPKDTRTPAQKEALKKLVKELKAKYPGATVHGHNEFAAKACPSFDVKKWLKEENI
jgi:N-acetylmuramoyl-L-alanine amidase